MRAVQTTLYMWWGLARKTFVANEAALLLAAAPVICADRDGDALGSERLCLLKHPRAEAENQRSEDYEFESESRRGGHRFKNVRPISRASRHKTKKTCPRNAHNVG